jgi:NAD(P)-dependent dehydrogenase (short-subunit alcohol dehydrogenase family)
VETALITRASVGLGSSLTLALAERGWRLVLGDADARRLEAQAAGLATATEVEAVPGDIADPEHREHLVALAGPSVDLVVNNAAPLLHHVEPAGGELPLDDLEDAYRDTVLAPLALVELVLPQLAPDGRIVNVIPRRSRSRRGPDVRDAAAGALEELTAAIADAHPHLHIHASDACVPWPSAVAFDGIIAEPVPS